MYPPLIWRSELSAREIAETGLVLRSVVDSSAHGLQISGTDDRDEMGVAIEPPNCTFGLSSFQQYIYRDAEERAKREGSRVHPQPRSRPGDLDLVVYGLKKFCRLAAAGNPSILVVLFTVPLFSDEIGAELIRQRDMFISREAGGRFLGYLRNQHERLLGHRGQMRVSRPELVDAYGYDTKYAGHAVRLGLQGLELMSSGTLSLPMRSEERDLVLNIRTGKYRLEEVTTMIEELEDDLVYAIPRSQLPREADSESINRFLESSYRRAYG
jgi:uncharacterized protein